MSEDNTEDREFAKRIYSLVVLPLRREVVASLLRGNDALCFTTEQYALAYEREMDRRFQLVAMYGPREEWAKMHLLSTGLVREHSPDVWVPV
jgi:hypothetical protein